MRAGGDSTNSRQIFFHKSRLALARVVCCCLMAVGMILALALPIFAKEGTNAAAETKPHWQGECTDGKIITENELAEILRLHALWLASDCMEGSRANLVKANLQRAPLGKANLLLANLREANLLLADLREANLGLADLWMAQLFLAGLEGAHLDWANLQGANLKEAKLEEAFLSSANLKDANLEKAVLRKADLWEANLWGANLLLADLGKANLRLADLREAKLDWVDLWQADLHLAELQKAQLKSALLEEADLTWANLQGAILTEAKLQKAKLQNTNLRDVDLWDANLSQADLSEAFMWGAKLQSADLREANLQRTILRGANLISAQMHETRLQNAVLIGTDLKGANLFKVELADAIFQPNAGFANSSTGLGLSTIRGLAELRFEDSAHALSELRAWYKAAGLREQERQVTYAIRHTQVMKDLKKSWWGSVWSYFAFDFTCAWGLAPFRPLWMMLILLLGPFWLAYFLFAFPSVLPNDGKNGIWKVWPDEALCFDPDKDRTSPLQPESGWQMLWFGLYFSLLSAFHIGWRDLNVGAWISRIFPKEYTLRATGGVRVVSGLQSLISVYLLALCILSYFGRPFE